MARDSKFSITMATTVFFVVAFSNFIPAQQRLPVGQKTPRVTQIDSVALKRLLKPAGKPLLINFWATWCVPCREEFPELVKIDADYRGKIDFITVSLDFPEDKDTLVPKFLDDMKAGMPAYLLVTPDESSAISAISKDWNGALPFTVLYHGNGSLAYFRQGKIKPDLVRSQLDKLIVPARAGQ